MGAILQWGAVFLHFGLRPCKCAAGDQDYCAVLSQERGTVACPGLLVQPREKNSYGDHFFCTHKGKQMICVIHYCLAHSNSIQVVDGLNII